MERKKVVLCKLNWDYCPEVEIHEDGNVTIGEDDNTVKLTKDQWNILVDKIKDGSLTNI